MHVAYNGWFWDQPHTGSGQYIRSLLNHLRRIAPSLEMTLVLPTHNQSLEDLPPNINVIRTQGFGGKLGKIWFEQQTFPKVVGKIDADIAHVPYWGPPLSSPAKLVTSLLDVIPLVIPDYSRGFGTRLYTSLVSTAVRGSAHIITLSHASRLDIEEQLNIPEEMITPIYLAPDERYHPRLGAENDEQIRTKYNLPEHFTFYLGGFDLRKQLNQLLLAYTYVVQAEGDEYPLVIAGQEPDWGTPLFPDMRQYAKELGIEEHIQWLGFVPEEDKAALYRLADVFVFPTRYEGFGLPILEAMASGTPVIANEVSCIPEIVGKGAFLVEPGDTRKMAGAIIALLTQDPLRNSQINAGLAQATRYQWRKTAQETLAVYERVLRL